MSLTGITRTMEMQEMARVAISEARAVRTYAQRVASSDPVAWADLRRLIDSLKITSDRVTPFVMSPAADLALIGIVQADLMLAFGAIDAAGVAVRDAYALIAPSLPREHVYDDAFKAHVAQAIPAADLASLPIAGLIAALDGVLG